MSTEQKETDQNALATSLTGAWADFKQGKLISYKLMAALLLIVAGLGLWWYIAAERRKVTSKEWLDFDEANSIEKLEKLASKPPVGRIAQLVVARSLLGTEGIDQINAPTTDKRQKAVENIEKAREQFGKLLPQFEKDPVLKAECLLGLAKAEAALVGVPVKAELPTGPGPIAPAKEAKGKVEVVIKYLDELAAAAAPDTPWATESKKLADELRKNPTGFEAIQRALTVTAPQLPEFDPHGPDGFPGMGGLPKMSRPGGPIILPK